MKLSKELKVAAKEVTTQLLCLDVVELERSWLSLMQVRQLCLAEFVRLVIQHKNEADNEEK